MACAGMVFLLSGLATVVPLYAADTPAVSASGTASENVTPSADSEAPPINGGEADENTVDESFPEEQPQAIDFDRMQREVEALRQFSSDEAEKALDEMARDRKSLLAAVKDLRQRREALAGEVEYLQRQYNGQLVTLRELRTRQRVDLASRKAVEGAVRLTAGAIRDRFAKSAYASLNPEMADAIAGIASAGSFPKLDDIKTVNSILFKELALAGAIGMRSEKLTLPNGNVAVADVLRVGGLLAAYRLPDGQAGFLQPVNGGRRLVVVQAEAPPSTLALVERAFIPGANAVPGDFSEGRVFKRFVDRKGFIEHILAGGVLIWPIIGLGGIALLIGLYRYLRLARVRFGNAALLEQFFRLAREGRLGEAQMALSENASRNVPVYRVLSHMLAEWGGTGISSMEKCRDEAIMNQMAPLERGISFVAIAAAVAPLLGLLGTVTGMISTFDIITLFGNSDPKLLSGGISVALVTTELGLVSAIPLMFLHFILSRRVAKLVNDMEEKGAVLIARVSAAEPAGEAGS
jgi:biopolymer transport protein ExbB